MKKNMIAFIPVLLLLMILVACKKNEQKLVAYTVVPANAAQTKVVNAMPYVRGPIQVKINDVRVSNNITYTTPFPGGGLNTQGSSNPDYLALNGGTTRVSFSIPNVGTSNDSIALFTGSVDLEGSKYQTVYATDTAANTQFVLVKDDIAAPDSGFSRFKFVNLIPNLAAIDLYFGSTLVAANLPYKGTSANFNLATGTAAIWAIRPAGAAPTSTAIAIYPSTGTYSVTNQRVMTVYSRGYNGLTSTDARRQMISLLFNR